MRRLLRSGADPNLADVKGQTALMRAAEGGHGAVADLLLAAKASVEHCDNKGKTALMRAAENRRVEMVEHLIKAGADPNHADKRGKTALMRAALGGAGEIVDQLLASGADANRMDANGWTALICGTGDINIMVRLIGAGANIEHAAQDGTTAISRAKSTGHGAVVALLEAEVRQRAQIG